jgi:hypothetical protein
MMVEEVRGDRRRLLLEGDEQEPVIDTYLDRYDHPVFDDGEKLVDMIYLRQEPDGSTQRRPSGAVDT